MEPGPETVFHSTSCDSFLAAAALRRGQGDPGGGGRKAAGLAPQAYGPLTAALWGADGWPGCRFPLAGFEASPWPPWASFLGACRPPWSLWHCQHGCPSWTAHPRPLHPVLSVGTLWGLWV